MKQGQLTHRWCPEGEGRIAVVGKKRPFRMLLAAVQSWRIGGKQDGYSLYGHEVSTGRPIPGFQARRGEFRLTKRHHHSSRS